MYEGDRSRKQTLVDYGFRLPSALDNRPQTFEEFLRVTPQIVLVSATPGEFERTRSARVVEQIVRPTGIVDPQVEVRATRNQIDDLMREVRCRVERDERVLVTTLTKKMAEDLSGYLLELGFRARYLHSEIDTLERIQIIRALRLGEYDVLVGVNLLREGLDLPEVSLVAILDADKEGFLRGETSLIQTIGRAARNIEGTVIMYADRETDSMRARSTRPTAAARSSSPTTRSTASHRVETSRSSRASPTSPTSSPARVARRRAAPDAPPPRSALGDATIAELAPHELEKLAVELEEEMLAAAEDFFCASSTRARLRDELRDLRATRRGLSWPAHCSRDPRGRVARRPDRGWAGPRRMRRGPGRCMHRPSGGRMARPTAPQSYSPKLQEALDRRLLVGELVGEVVRVVGGALEEVGEAVLGVVGQRVDVRDLLLDAGDPERRAPSASVRALQTATTLSRRSAARSATGISRCAGSVDAGA
jgi:hypothetical protein